MNFLPKFPAEGYKQAYDALVHASNALIHHYGYRPTTERTHVTLVEVTRHALGKDSERLVRRFETMRRKRHPLQYEATFAESVEQVQKAIDDARELVKKIEDYIEIQPPRQEHL